MRRNEQVQIQIPIEHVEAIGNIAAIRRVAKTQVYREAVEAYLALIAGERPELRLPPREPGSAKAAPATDGLPTVAAPTRGRPSTRAHPWRGSAVMPRVIPGGRRER